MFLQLPRLPELEKRKLALQKPRDKASERHRFCGISHQLFGCATFLSQLRGHVRGPSLLSLARNPVSGWRDQPDLPPISRGCPTSAIEFTTMSDWVDLGALIQELGFVVQSNGTEVLTAESHVNESV